MSFDLQVLNGDLVYSQGDVNIVENGQLLVQECVKILSTPLGSNTYIPGYGSTVDMVIGSAFTGSFSSDIATQQTLSALEMLQKNQQDQLKQNQIVTQDEQLAGVLNCYVSRAPYDLRLFVLAITIVSKAFQAQNFTLVKS